MAVSSQLNELMLLGDDSAGQGDQSHDAQSSHGNTGGGDIHISGGSAGNSGSGRSLGLSGSLRLSRSNVLGSGVDAEAGIGLAVHSGSAQSSRHGNRLTGDLHVLGHEVGLAGLVGVHVDALAKHIGAGDGGALLTQNLRAGCLGGNQVGVLNGQRDGREVQILAVEGKSDPDGAAQSGVLDDVRDGLYEVLDAYKDASLYVEFLSEWFKNEVGGV